MSPFYEHAGVTIYLGDCREIVPQLSERFDACVTDPPYHLTQASRRGSPRQNDPETPYGRTRLGSAGFMGKTWDGGDVAFRPETWGIIAGALKPGAHVMAFGGTRTFHRLACAIEDAGFEIRDTLMWLYGTGFPKSLNIAKAMDRMTTDVAVDAEAWEGYGTALKPAWEPIILGMKPCGGTFAENALEHGVAGLNVDGSRIGTAADMNPNDFDDAKRTAPKFNGILNGGKQGQYRSSPGTVPAGRWPANLLLDEEAAALLDEQGSFTISGAMKRAVGSYDGDSVTGFLRGNSGPHNQHGDSGGASRFFYKTKADSTERGTGNNHPTVKPLDLMRYLCKLLAPPRGGLFLEPFAGSGTTLIACKALNIRAVGIELSEEYAEIAAKRLAQDVLEFI